MISLFVHEGVESFQFPSIVLPVKRNLHKLVGTNPCYMKVMSEISEMEGKTDLDLDSLLPEMNAKMQQSISSLQKNLSSVLVGRASPDLLSRTTVRAYGVSTPVSHLATITVVGMQSLTVEPYDSSHIKSIIRAIVEGNNGLIPTQDGNLIYINVPLMNEEVRLQMAKKCKDMCEEGKISVRNNRRRSMNLIKRMKKFGVLSQDDQKIVEAEVQKNTEKFIDKIENLAQLKHKEVMMI